MTVARLALLGSMLMLAACGSRGVSMGDELAMVPGPTDNGGCRMHSLQSGQQRLKAIFYETRQGDFTTDRDEACR